MKTKKASHSRVRKQLLERRARRIKYRLRDIDWPEQSRPMFTSATARYEVADRIQATASGGISVMNNLVHRVGLDSEINQRLNLLKRHKPYHESDHVLNVAFGALSGGGCLEDLERLRNDEAYLNSLGAQRIPDPTTAGDFCRRFEAADVSALMEAINESRLRVWGEQPQEFFEEAVLDADGTLASTYGQCKEGADFSYNGTFGYHPLVVSLANTQEPLFLVNRPGNRPSHEGAAEVFDQAIALCRRAGFRHVTLRGDTDFSQTEHLDRWHDDGISFAFGFDACPNLVEKAQGLPAKEWQRLERPPRESDGEPRARPENVKEQAVIDRKFKNIRLQSEWVAKFNYQPRRCRRSYEMLVVRKELNVLKGQRLLFKDQRFFFYITNIQHMDPSAIVAEANQRCNQENLIEQLKNGPRALSMPVNGLVSNWAYAVMASLAWTLKAWFALLLPEKGRWQEKHKEEKERVLRMDFRQFVREMIMIPAQVVRQGRRLIIRLLSWTRHAQILLRGIDVLEQPLRC